MSGCCTPDEILAGRIAAMMAGREPTPWTRPVWHDLAACRPGVCPASLSWFATTKTRMAQAVAVCSTCEVIDECRTAADLNGEVIGVWAAMTPSRRRQQRRQDAA